jgi:hypothetical protein
MRWTGENGRCDQETRKLSSEKPVAEGGAAKRARLPPLTFVKGAYYSRGARVRAPSAK